MALRGALEERESKAIGTHVDILSVIEIKTYGQGIVTNKPQAPVVLHSECQIVSVLFIFLASFAIQKDIFIFDNFKTKYNVRCSVDTIKICLKLVKSLGSNHLSS